MLVAITGTPGTGKSTLALELAKKNFYRIDLHDHYKKLSVGYNRSKRCYDLDMAKVEKLVRQTLQEQEDVVLDSHISHLLPSELVDVCVVMQCSDLKVLETRLVARKYHKAKVQENLDCEIFQVCLLEAKELGHTIVEVDSCAISATKAAKLVIDKIKGR